MKKGATFLSRVINQLYTRLIKNKYLITVFFLIGSEYWILWGRGPRVAADFQMISQSELREFLNIPRTWSFGGLVGLGGYSATTLWSWPKGFVLGIFSNLGLRFEILERILLIIPTILGGVYGIWNLLKEYKLSNTSRLISTVFYLSNTYILLLIDGGQLGIGLAYAWLPVCYLIFERSKQKGIKNKLFAGISLWILGILDIRFVFVLGLLLIIRFLFVFVLSERPDGVPQSIERIKTALIATIIFVGLNAFWIYPLIKFPFSGIEFSSLTKSSDINFTQLKHSLSLLQPHWYENIFGNIHSFRKEFLIIPLLVFLAPVLNRKNKEVIFWVIVAVISVFLAKGANPPLASVFPWLFFHIPGFSLFRDTTKFFFLVSLSYSVLLSFTINSIIEKFPKHRALFSGMILAYLIFLAYPIYTGKMTGIFSYPRFKNEYSVMDIFLEKDKGLGGILWVPSRPPLGNIWPNHLPVDSLQLVSNRVFSGGIVGNYETSNWLRDASYSGQLLSIAGVKYVVYSPLDPLREEMKPDQIAYHQLFQNQLENAAWAQTSHEFGLLKAIETRNHQGLFWIPEKTWFVVGSDEILTTGLDLSKEALIFAENNPEILTQINRFPNAGVKLYRKSSVDVAAALLPENNLIYPSRLLKNDPDNSGWWKRDSGDFLWWRDFLQTKYGLDNQDFDYKGGWAIAEGELKISIKTTPFSKEKILLARVMKSPQGGSIKFYQKGKLIGQIDTLVTKPEKKTILSTDKQLVYDRADFGWYEIGKIESGNVLIQTEGKINVVNLLTTVGEDEWLEINNQAQNLLSKKTENLSASILDYQNISPSHYKVKLDGQGPQTLVFSQSYDPRWATNGLNSIEAYGFLNAFPVSDPGEYDIYFTPQKYVLPGLVISGATLLILLGIWIYTKSSTPKP